MMSIKIVLLLVSVICSVKFSESGTVVPPFTYDPSDLRAGAPAVTNSPMNFTFTDVQPVFTGFGGRLSFISELAFDNLTNTGKYLGLAPTTPSLTYTTHGALFNETYTLSDGGLFWSSNPAVPAGQVVNGIGEPLEVRIAYRNTKYSTIAIAETKPDGFVIISFRVRVDNFGPNPTFAAFLKYVGKITTPGSSTLIPRFFLTYWFNSFLHYPGYFFYPGSYLDPITLQPHSAATNIVHTLFKGPRISQDQLNELVSLLGYDCPLTTYAQDSRNVFWTGPIQEVLTPPFPITVGGATGS